MISAKGAHGVLTIDRQLELDKSRMQVPMFMMYGWPQEYICKSKAGKRNKGDEVMGLNSAAVYSGRGGKRTPRLLG